MWPDRVSNPGPLTYESGALLIALQGLALSNEGGFDKYCIYHIKCPRGFAFCRVDGWEDYLESKGL